MNQDSQNMTRDELLEYSRQLEKTNERLAQQNMKLVLLAKDKDQRLYQQELVIRRYRTRLVRWFEDMTYDPLENEEFDQEIKQSGNIKLENDMKRE
uniref:Uncharacterized protein n=1 Tax=Trepomonas sp. PC1 TaxID=1076344 RepID=A0A146K3B1_9EUKA|eukprot:JAP91390.1 hypothetical protein TPC1_17018 [Trepomonas sp. PC1]